jgi:hypothetical protein
MRTVYVTIEGGVIQDIALPEGVRVVVWDYDVETETETETDADGNERTVTIWD